MIRHIVGAALAAVLAFAAADQVAAQQPVRGGQITFPVVGDPPSYDCAVGSSVAAADTLSPHYSGLLRYDLAHYPNIVGDVAESWTVSADGKTVTFRLRENVRFHDNSVLVADDVRATYERLRNPPPGVVSVRQAHFADIDSIATPDERTVVFRLKRRNAAILHVFASPWNCLYSARRMANDPNYPMRVVMGTGPFRFVEHVVGARWVGARFDGYFRPGLPYLDGFQGVFLSPSAVTQTLLRGRQIDADFRTITPAERESLTAAMGNQIRFLEATGMNSLLISFNTERPPFNDARVRRALSLAIDRWGGAQGMARTSNARIVGGLIRPGSEFAATEAEMQAWPGFGRDMAAARAEARRLLAEAGVPNLRVTLTNRPVAVPFTIAGIYVIDQWRQIGVTTEHRQVETGPWLAALSSGQFDVIFDNSNEYTDEPNIVLPRYLSHTRAPANSARYNDPTLDDLFDRQVEAATPAERRALLRQFETRLLTEAYVVPLFWISRIVPLTAPVMGWNVTGGNTLGQDLTEVWLNR